MTDGHDSSRSPAEKDARIRDALLQGFQEVEMAAESSDERGSLSFFLLSLTLLLLLAVHFLGKRSSFSPRTEKSRMSTEVSGKSGGQLLTLAAPSSSQTMLQPTSAPSGVRVPQPASNDTREGSDLIQALRDDDICRVLSALDGEIMPVVRDLPEFGALSPEVRAWIESAHAQAAEEKLEFLDGPSDWLSFQKALVLSGQTSLGFPTGDVREARQALELLSNQNPGNGAFPLFLLPVLEREGASPEELVRAAELFLSAEDFDAGVESAMEEISRSFSASVSSYAMGLAIQGGLPFPDPDTAVKTLEGVLRERPEWSSALSDAERRIRILPQSTSRAHETLARLLEEGHRPEGCSEAEIRATWAQLSAR